MVRIALATVAAAALVSPSPVSEEQLGLRLVAARSPVDVIVIDRIVQPTEN